MNQEIPDTVVPIVFDAETSVNCTIGSNKAHPAWPDNKIVLAGIRSCCGSIPTGTTILTEELIRKIEPATKHNEMLVGVNLPFDLRYMYKTVEAIYNYRGRLLVWDCQVAEYLLTRQQAKYPSLDEMAVKYGGTLKPSKIKGYWDAGIKTEHIPLSELTPYLEGDINNTALVYKAQVKEVLKRGMLPLVMAHMQATQAITDMMDHGMAVDKSFLIKREHELASEILMLRERLEDMASSETGIPPVHININSPKSLSLVLFGGETKAKVRVSDGVYKNGNPKFKTEIVTTKHGGYGYIGYVKTVHGWSTDDETLEKLSFSAGTFVTELRRYRGLVKEHGTYFLPTLGLIFPDGKIYPNLHQTSTNTGRLSCTEPNLQNLTSKETSDIKKAYVSRWGSYGRLIEIDYRQLEIAALAYLSGDRQLIKDVNDGVDIHTELYRSMYGGKFPTPEERRAFKRLSFALIYGSGIKNMAEQAHVTEKVAKAFKTTFFSRYPGVRIYNLHVKANIYTNRIVNGHGNDPATGLPLANSHFQLPTGRELYYREYVKYSYDRPGTVEGTDFSYTEICNYPIQSFATGDLVPIMLGRLWRAFVTNNRLKENALLVCTVHDSVLIDCKNPLMDEAIQVAKEVLESAPAVMKELFGIDMSVKTPVSISTGPSWFDQTEISAI